MPAIDSNLPDKVKQKLPMKPWLYMANYWSHPSDPSRNYDFYNTEGDERLDFLLDDDSHLHADNWGNINVLLMARGCLKTTSLIGIGTWFIHTYPQGDILMAAPRESQVHEFVEKFKDKVDETGLDQYREKNRMGTQKFVRDLTDENGEEFTAKSYLNTTSAWGDGDAARGYHTHLGIIDEFQDVDEGTFSTFLEAIDQELSDCDAVPSIFIIGTPKMKNSFFHEMWEESDQKTWDEEEKEWIHQDEAGQYAPPKVCEVCETKVTNVTDECPECSAPMEWDDGSVFDVRGWHIDQYNSPLHDQGTVEMKRQKYSERKFKNEVLAEFYTPEDDLLSQDDVMGCVDPELSFRDRRRFEDSTVTIGVDWGGGQDEKAADTVVTVGEHVTTEDGETETTVLSVDFLDNTLSKDEEIKQLEQKMIRYDVDQVIVDEGFGTKQREDLQNGTGTTDPSGYPELVKGVRYGNVSNPTDLKWEANSGERRFATVNKSYQIETLVDDFRKFRIQLPGGSLSFSTDNDAGTKLVKQLTAPYKDLVETPSGSKKVRVQSDRNDDAIDSFVYMMLAHREAGAGLSTTKMVAHDRF